MATVTHVVFNSIYPRFEIVVPVAEAFTFYDSCSRLSNAVHNQRVKLTTELTANLARTDKCRLSDDAYQALHKLDVAPLQHAGVSLEVTDVIWDNDPTLRTFAKAWMVWDFANVITRLYAIGIGCNSGHDIKNPAVEGKRKSLHYVQDAWVSGINWDTRDKTVYPEAAA